ncbi:hypothetical protein SLA2020_117270 [Shorea laevis]
MADITSFASLNLSRVWSDIIRIGKGFTRLDLMLVQGFMWHTRDGDFVGFWKDKWVEDKPLNLLFPRLFVLTCLKDGLVKDMGYWDGDAWQWRMEWRRACLGREVGEEERFWSVLSKARLTKGGMDIWKWVHDSNGDYTVKAAYNFFITY